MSRRHVFVWLLAAAALVARAPAASAQLSPADSAAVLLDAAKRFEAEGRSEVAEALYRFVGDHFAATPSGSQALARLTTVQSVGAQRSGRVELQIWTTLYGLFLGVAVPGAFGANDSEPYGLGLLAGGPVGFMAGGLIARSRNLTEGQARAITLGGSWGIWQGAGWAAVLDLGHQEICIDDAPFPEYCYEEGDGSEEMFTSMIVGSLAGMVAGAALSTRPITPGTATTVNFGALWGTWFGVASGVLLDLEGDALMAATLMGGNAGLVTTAVLAPGWNVSRSRARIVSIFGVIGGLSGLGIDLLAQPDDDKTAIGIPLGTSVVGLALGMMRTRDYDRGTFSPGEAGAFSGALLDRTRGSWSVGVPVPRPVLLELDGPRGRERKAGLGLTLLQAAF